MKQSLLWIPIGKPVEWNDELVKVDPVPYKGKKPTRLWTLFEELYSNKRPNLPFKPVHHQNAFIEDYIHDYDIKDGFLRYYSRVSSGGNWVLLEFE